MIGPGFCLLKVSINFKAMRKVNLAIVDDQQLFREGLIALISDVPHYHFVMEADSGSSLLNQLAEASTLPNVLLMDLKLPDINGVQLNNMIKQQYPSVHIIVVSMYNEERLIARMIEAGASGYLEKNCSKAELMTAIDTTMQLGFYFNLTTLKAIHHSRLYKKAGLKTVNSIELNLTTREIEILKMICMELTNAEIAQQLFLSARTVDGHRNNLLAKTGCKNTAGLVIFAIRNAIYELEP
jgi:DNA-binding NarL/FixJ family response regulator